MKISILKSLLKQGFSKEKIRQADLRQADLRQADLRQADLRQADLREADLRQADLRQADLSAADLRQADLIRANLREADLREANLSGANLSGADLRGADLRGAITNYFTIGYHIQCPEVGAFVAFKKARGKVITLKIHEDSLRSSATGSKCRCNKATVIDIEGGGPVRSNWDSDFVYEIGKTIVVNDFDTDRWNECSTGIHFFMNRANAESYE